MLVLFFALTLTGCENTQQPQTKNAESHTESQLVAEVPSVPQIDPPNSLELYSTLAGKMARMEQILGAIDRFLDNPDFRDRLCADAEEFHQLLTESRGLYPKELSLQDRSKFDQAIDRTAATSKQLLVSLKASNKKAAREALNQLGKKRQEAHTKFSYPSTQ